MQVGTSRIGGHRGVLLKDSAALYSLNIFQYSGQMHHSTLSQLLRWFKEISTKILIYKLKFSLIPYAVVDDVF